MKSIRSALSSHPQRTVGIAILAMVLGVTAFAPAPSNMVSVFRNGGVDCWLDLNPCSGNWDPNSACSTSEARDEAEAGRTATGYGKFVGIRPMDVAASRMQMCGVWTPGD